MPIHGAALSLYAADGQRKYLNADERRRFLAAAQLAPPKTRTLCLTMAYLGCRISEALGLTGGDVQTTEGIVSIRCLKKRGKLVVREVPMPPALIEELARVHLLDLPRALLWPWGRTTAWRLIKTVMSEAGIHSLPATPKGLRHGFGVHAVMCGVPLNIIQKWLGHADIASTAIYTNVLGPEERAIASRMW
ncbi:MAG: tyrosine-type recombinase/integrase [Bradyrhizobium sp.]|nr:tyrosine-type recombinase/integrase [Bradyrhizobium sp.]